MGSSTVEWAWKIGTAVIGLALVPLVGWIWSTQSRVTTLETENSYRKSEIVAIKAEFDKIDNKVDELQNTSNDVGWIKGELDEMSKGIERIETRLDQLL